MYHVTQLNAAVNDAERNDPGTLFYGLNDNNFTNHPPGTPRTIVFDVAGVFHLGRLDETNWTSGGNAWDAQSRRSISSDNITIAGQSAPGPVIVMGGELKLNGSNLILRNMTIAPGYGVRNFWEPGDPPPSPSTLPDGYKMRGLNVSGQTIMIDHVSAVYPSTDTITCNPSANNLTVQNCNTSRGQTYAEEDWCYTLLGDTDHMISLVGNLAAHHAYGLPYLGSESGTGPQSGFRNNVFYNWIGYYAGYATAFTAPSRYSKNNFVQNFYLAGNGGDLGPTNSVPGGTGVFNGYQSYGTPVGPDYTSVYRDGNLMDSNRDGDPGDGVPADGDYVDCVIKPAAYDLNIGLTLTAQAAFTNVLRHVGARWWERDYDFMLGNTNAIDTVDERLIHEVFTGTGQVRAWADDPFDTNSNEGVEWRSLWALRPDTNGMAPFNHPAGWDTDQDGMPDHWEEEHGLDPNVANNNADFDNDGYTDLEECLNDIAAWPAPGQILFTGYTNSRYALIHNWHVIGEAVNIAGIGNLPTSSPWQPSRYDTALVSDSTVTVDAVGQHAGTLSIADSGTLNITGGWLKVADTLEIGTSSAATATLSGGRLQATTLTKGGSGAFNFTGGTLSAGTIHFDLLSQGGTIALGTSPGQTVVNGDLTLQPGSVLDFELGAADTNDSDIMIVNGNLTLGGSLDVTSLPGFGVGTYTLITYSGTLDGSLALGSTPPGFACLIDTTTSGEVRLTAANLPEFHSSYLDKGNLILLGTGPNDWTYHLLTSPDLSLPLSLWTPTLTNVFSNQGEFIITNDSGVAEAQQFYLLRLP